MKIRTRKVYNLLVEGYCRYLYIKISPESVQTNHCRNGGNMRFLMDDKQFTPCNLQNCPLIKELKE